MWDSEDWGSCELMNDEEKENVLLLVEGCVNAAVRTIDPDYLTNKKFGCVNHKAK